jgi:hypothetical protein
MPHADLVFYGFFLIVAFAILPPLRALLLWAFKELAPHSGLWGHVKTVVHALWQAHATLLRNLQPRAKVLMELERKRTSYTEDV